MKDVLYAVKDIRAKELNKITDELDADMQIVWQFITETIIRGTGRETTVWNLCQRDLVKIRLENLGYACQKNTAMGQKAAIKMVLGSYGGTIMLKLKRPVMTFNQFSKWCSARAADGYWDFGIALCCSQICSDVCNQKWWRREKYFRENYDVEGIYKGTVCEINDIINYNRKVKKGEFE